MLGRIWEVKVFSQVDEFYIWWEKAGKLSWEADPRQVMVKQCSTSEETKRLRHDLLPNSQSIKFIAITGILTD